MPRQPVNRRHAERGAVAVTTVLLFAVLMGFFALAFNVGLLLESRSELQNGSDSAALAGARSLNGMASGLTAARQSAYDYSMKHLAYDQQITIDAFGADLIFGRWHLRASDCLYGSGGTDCFEPLPLTDPRKITAVKILNGRDGGTHNPPLDLFFGQYVGTATANVRSAAVAVGGGSAAPNCALPLTLAQCVFVNPDTGQMNCGADMPLVFSNANSDGIGFINLYYPDDTQAPSGTFAADVINNRSCKADHYTIGPAKVQNGNDFSKVNDALRGVDSKGNAIGPCLLGQAISWAVTDAGCPSNPTFQGVDEVVGFVKAIIVEVTDNKGNALGCPGTTAAPVPGSPKNAIVVNLPCQAGTEPGDFGGGRAYNTGDIPIRLVQ
jgi:hypothetical protein